MHEEEPPCNGMPHVLEPLCWPETKVERVENKHILRRQWPVIVIVPPARTPCEILSQHADVYGRELVMKMNMNMSDWPFSRVREERAQHERVLRMRIVTLYSCARKFFWLSCVCVCVNTCVCVCVCVCACVCACVCVIRTTVGNYERLGCR